MKTTRTALLALSLFTLTTASANIEDTYKRIVVEVTQQQSNSNEPSLFSSIISSVSELVWDKRDPVAEKIEGLEESEEVKAQLLMHHLKQQRMKKVCDALNKGIPWDSARFELLYDDVLRSLTKTLHGEKSVTCNHVEPTFTLNELLNAGVAVKWSKVKISGGVCLALGHLNLTDISGIASVLNIGNITLLILQNNRLTDLAPLAVATKTKSLIICNNKIHDLGVIKNMPNLEVVLAENNDLTSIDISGNPHLWFVDVTGNHVKEKNAIGNSNLDLSIMGIEE